MHLCLFEDTLVQNFLPLVHLRPVYDLRSGMFTLRERTVKYLSPSSLTLFVRGYLAPLVRDENPGVAVNAIPTDACLFVNGRCIMTPAFAKVLKKTSPAECLFISNGEVIAARLGKENLQKLGYHPAADADMLDFEILDGVERIAVEAGLVQYPWNLMYSATAIFQDDFRLLVNKGAVQKGNVHKSAILVGKKQISIGKKSRIDPGVVLVADEGPIFIGNEVHIHPTTVIEGPCFVGDGSIIKVGTKIYGHTTIGPSCKVGGEIEQSIIHSHSNKQHDGFLGHSYIGQWVNLGAGTTTSNLKNTYGNVRVEVAGKRMDTEKMFLGTIAGDHVKTGINMSLAAGTVIGTSSNIYGPDIPPAFIRPFSWGQSGDLTNYDVDKALAVAVKVIARRKIQASVAYQDAFREIHTMTMR